jgi:dolichol-phosphate mannosyltransferase
MTSPELSIVVPAFNEAANVAELLRRVRAAAQQATQSFEIIVVDDGSHDGTYEATTQAAEPAEHLHVLRLSRNFGHQAALLAGLRAARGAAVIMLDADLQHPPEAIPELIAMWRQGFEIVHCVRQDTEASAGPLKRLTSKLFYKLFRVQSGLPIEPGMTDYRLVDRRALDPVLKSERHRLFLRGMFVWVGFRQTCVTFQCAPRLRGQSSYSWMHMLRFASHAILAFSEAPLYWSLLAGLGLSAFSIVYGLYAVGIWAFTDTAVPGWTSLVALVAFLFGAQFMLMGVLGAYVGAIYAEVKDRPPYVVAQAFASTKTPSQTHHRATDGR